MPHLSSVHGKYSINAVDWLDDTGLQWPANEHMAFPWVTYCNRIIWGVLWPSWYLVSQLPALTHSPTLGQIKSEYPACISGYLDFLDPESRTVIYIIIIIIFIKYIYQGLIPKGTVSSTYMHYPVESSPLEWWYHHCPHFIEEEVKVKRSSATDKCHRTIKYQDGIFSLNPTLALNCDHTICFRILSVRLNIFLKIQLPRNLNIDSCFRAKKLRDHRVYIVIYFMACIY